MKAFTLEQKQDWVILLITAFWLFPGSQPVVSRFMMILYTIGETPIIFWLLIKGTKSVIKKKINPAINPSMHLPQ
jgi:hypothetical protein